MAIRMRRFAATSVLVLSLAMFLGTAAHAQVCTGNIMTEGSSCVSKTQVIPPACPAPNNACGAFFGKGDPGLLVLIKCGFSGLGGPIIKDKAFFFYNFEGSRISSAQPVVQLVPLATSPDPNNPGTLGDGVVHYAYCTDPACNGTAVASLNAKDMAAAFPGVTVTDPNCPAATSGTCLNPTAQAVFANSVTKYKTNDTTVGDQLNTGGFRFNSLTPVHKNSHVAKFDFNVTKNQTAFLRLNVIYDHQTLTRWLPDSKAPQVWSHPWGIAAGHTWTLGQNWVNSFRYGYTRQAFTDVLGRWVALAGAVL